MDTKSRGRPATGRTGHTIGIYATAELRALWKAASQQSGKTQTQVLGEALALYAKKHKIKPEETE